MSTTLDLDHAATAPVRRSALEAMWPALTGVYGNPSSAHEAGRAAAALLEDARARVARAIGARAGQVVFTSGGTEADALAVLGTVRARILAGRPAGHVLTTGIEHSAVRQSCDQLARLHGVEVEHLALDRDGLTSADDLAARLRPDTALVSVHLAHNEVGTVQPVAELAAVAREAGVPLHVDAVQAAGQIPVDVRALGADLVALSGHKVGGPKGVGALWVRPGHALEPLVPGGGQERGRRSGTQNVAGAAGFAAAFEEAEAERAAAADAWAGLRDRFAARLLDGVRELVPDARLTGHPARRLPRHASFVLPGVNGESVLEEAARRGVLASAGSACSAHDAEPSPALLALGLSEDEARTALRCTFGPDADAPLLDAAADAIVDAVRTVSALR